MRIEPERQLHLDGRELGYELVIRRGAIGELGIERRATTKTLFFATFARAVEDWGTRCARRRRHGYEEVRQHA